MIKKDGSKMSAAIKMLKGNFDTHSCKHSQTHTVHTSHTNKEQIYPSAVHSLTDFISKMPAEAALLALCLMMLRVLIFLQSLPQRMTTETLQGSWRCCVN